MSSTLTKKTTNKSKPKPIISISVMPSYLDFPHVVHVTFNAKIWFMKTWYWNAVAQALAKKLRSNYITINTFVVIHDGKVAGGGIYWNRFLAGDDVLREFCNIRRDARAWDCNFEKFIYDESVRDDLNTHTNFGLMLFSTDSEDDEGNLGCCLDVAKQKLIAIDRKDPDEPEQASPKQTTPATPLVVAS